MSNTDVGKSDPQWECTPLTVEDVLKQGEHFAFYVIRVLRWLG